MAIILDVFYPLFFYYLVGIFVNRITGTALDALSRTALMALLACPAAGWIYRRERKKQHTEKKKMPVGSYWIPCILGAVGNFFCSWLMVLSGVTGRFSNEVQEELLTGNLAVQIAGLGILIPVAEELIFRGLMYGNMKKYVSAAQAVVLGALIFALYHGNPIQMIYAFPMGILLNVVYEKWGSLTAPILLHMSANLSTVFLPLLNELIEKFW
ncbi:MAG: type II CAAX endopeptidase family protein [Candidatus Limivivens sp.]|nr:type II CAAX endopeptidase family protein [Candidatus Limivivens sp.]